MTRLRLDAAESDAAHTAATRARQLALQCLTQVPALLTQLSNHPDLDPAGLDTVERAWATWAD